MGGDLLKRALIVAAVVAAIALPVPAWFAAARNAADQAMSWDRPDEQYRQILGNVPYDLLRAADATLSPDATVLLVTPGRDVRQREYTTFHRALYFLAPRPVHWITPAPGDGTWEARWWRTVPLDAGSICHEIERTGASDLLLLDLAAPAPPCPGAGWTVELLPDGGTLVRLAGGAGGEAAAVTPPPLPPAGAWPLRLALALAVPLVLGAWFAALILRRGPRLAAWHRLAVAWILGTGAVTLGTGGLGALGIPAGARLTVLTAAAIVAAGWLFAGWWRTRRTRRTARPAARSPRRGLVSPLSAVLLVVLGLQVALVALVAVGRPLHAWDGWATWGMKARVTFLEGGVSETIYADPTRASTLLDYPLHLPLLEAWVYSWLGAPDDRLVGMIGLFTYIALLDLCFGAMRRWGASPPAALGVAALVGSITHVWGLAASGFADLPLALLLTAAAVHLIDWLDEGSVASLLVAAVSAGLMPWTKKEGLLLLAVLAVVCGLAGLLAEPGRRRRAQQAVPALLTAGALIAGGWWAFVALNGVPDPVYRTNPQALIDNAGRVPTIVAMQAQMLAGPAWSYVWPAAAAIGVAALVSWVASRRRAESTATPGGSARWLLPATAVLSLVVLSGSYVFTTFEPYTAQILSSGYRLALDVLPITALWLGHRLLIDRVQRPRAQDRQCGPSSGS